MTMVSHPSGGSWCSWPRQVQNQNRPCLSSDHVLPLRINYYKNTCVNINQQSRHQSWSTNLWPSTSHHSSISLGISLLTTNKPLMNHQHPPATALQPPVARAPPTPACAWRSDGRLPTVWKPPGLGTPLPRAMGDSDGYDGYDLMVNNNCSLWIMTVIIVHLASFGHT